MAVQMNRDNTFWELQWLSHWCISLSKGFPFIKADTFCQVSYCTVVGTYIAFPFDWHSLSF